MCVSIIELIPIVSTIAIALFALSIGGYPRVLKAFFYLRFPPARFYFNAMRAIEKLATLSYTSPSSVKGDLKQGVIGVSDIGFKELLEILQQKRMINGEVEEIVLGEITLDTELKLTSDSPTFKEIPITPGKMMFLGVIQKGKEVVVQQEQFDVNRITQNLKDWVEEITRNRVANWIFGVLVIYLIASLYLEIIR